MSWKIAALVLVATNGWLAYCCLDQGVTLVYRDQVLYELANKLKATTAIADLSVQGKPKAEAVGLLKRIFPGEEPFIKEGEINTTWLSIKLASGETVQGLQVDETVSHWALPPQAGGIKDALRRR